MEGYKFIKNGPDFKRRKYTNCQLLKFETIEIWETGESIYNKTANKLIKSLGIVIGNGPLKISNLFNKSGSNQSKFLFAQAV
jgi:hypothetical protein